MRFGYIRVSTVEQCTDRQKAELEAIVDEIYIDKASGKDLNREQWQELNKVLRKGDTVVVKELDRLSRNLADIKNIYEDFSNRGIYIEVLENTILSTYGKSEVERELITPIVIHLLGYMAEKERLKIKQRQAEGIKQAKAKGKHLGRPVIELTTKQKGAINQWVEGKINGVQCMALTGLKKTKLYELKKEFEAKK